MITWTQAIAVVVFIVAFEAYRYLQSRIDQLERRLTAYEQGRLVRA